MQKRAAREGVLLRGSEDTHGHNCDSAGNRGGFIR